MRPMRISVEANIIPTSFSLDGYIKYALRAAVFRALSLGSQLVAIIAMRGSCGSGLVAMAVDERTT